MLPIRAPLLCRGGVPVMTPGSSGPPKEMPKPTTGGKPKDEEAASRPLDPDPIAAPGSSIRPRGGKWNAVLIEFLALTQPADWHSDRKGQSVGFLATNVSPGFQSIEAALGLCPG